jgi:pyruvate,orthophosphate dikinase
MSTHRWVHSFDETIPSAPAETALLLGGKGASLAAMTRAGLRVPPWFTITTEACRHFYEHGQQWPEELEGQVRAQLARLEEKTGRRFGRGSSPLFVSVRSGAAVSMPGMMDTILNCGIHPGLAAEAGDTPQFWRVCVQFIETFAKTVGGVEFHVAAEEPSAERARSLMAEFAERTGKPFPNEPWDLLAACIDAVFRSWNSERAVAYRKRNDVRGLPGTAVNVQVMFPSRMSGVVFTQDPNNPAAQQMVIESAYGLGEAVVSGDVTPDRFVVQREDFSAIQTFRGTKGGAGSASSARSAWRSSGTSAGRWTSSGAGPMANSRCCNHARFPDSRSRRMRSSRGAKRWSICVRWRASIGAFGSRTICARPCARRRR